MALQLLLFRGASGVAFIKQMQGAKTINGRRIIVALILVGAVGALVRNSIGTCSIVQGVSMYPTFSPDDVVQSKTPNARSERGDVVIVTDDKGNKIIKRIVGLPGETVTIYRGFVYINGQRLNETYLPTHTYTFESDSRLLRRIDWRLDNNQFFVMGDNRVASYDSRNFGPIEKDNILGVVNLPSNSARPGFCELMLSENGKVIRTQKNPSQNRARTDRQVSNAKI